MPAIVPHPDAEITIGYTRTTYRKIIWHFYWEREDSQFWPRPTFNRIISESIKNDPQHSITYLK